MRNERCETREREEREGQREKRETERERREGQRERDREREREREREGERVSVVVRTHRSELSAGRMRGAVDFDSPAAVLSARCSALNLT